jgi:hypothetical protein
VVVGVTVPDGDIVLVGSVELVDGAGGAPTTSPSQPATSATSAAPQVINAYLVLDILFFLHIRQIFSCRCDM